MIQACLPSYEKPGRLIPDFRRGRGCSLRQSVRPFPHFGDLWLTTVYLNAMVEKKDFCEVPQMKINLSDGEWKLMNLLWAQSPRTITGLTAALKGDTGWSKNTVITMLSRLEGKGAVRFEAGTRARQYYPAFLKEDAVGAETKNFLGKVYGGSLGLMVNAMVQSRSLTPEEIAELTAILEQARKEKP